MATRNSRVATAAAITALRPPEKTIATNAAIGRNSAAFRQGSRPWLQRMVAATVRGSSIASTQPYSRANWAAPWERTAAPRTLSVPGAMQGT